jgi:hypothetical protein
MSQTAAHLVDHVIPHVPVRQWVLSLPIPLRVLLAEQTELITLVLQVVQRVVSRQLLQAARLKPDEGHGGAVTLIQRFGSAANLNIHLHGLLLDGVYRCGAEGVPEFVEVGSPTDDEVHALLQAIITRLMKLLTRRGVLVGWSRRWARPTWPILMPTARMRALCGHCRPRPSPTASPSAPAPGRRC